MGVKIISVNSYFPKNFHTISEFKKSDGWDGDNILKTTGINKRYISSKNEDVISLSIRSAKKIINRKNKKKIDFLIFVSQTSPYKFPSVSCILQNALGLKNDIFAIDINLGCSGFIYALKIANSLYDKKNMKQGLIICSDTYTKFIGKKNKSCKPIFSDASTCSLIKLNANQNKTLFSFGVDGKGYKDLYLSSNSKEMFMNGPKIAIFTLNEIPNFIINFLKKNKINKKKIKYFLFHQASKFVCNKIAYRLSLQKKQIINNFQNYGNTISSSIPLLIKDLMNKKKIKKGDTIIACGFGVGLSWGVAKIKW